MSLESQTEYLRKVLLAQFDATKIYRNPNTNGTIKEGYLRKALRPKIPEVIGLGKGEVMDSAVRKTGEIDIVFHDKFYSPLFEDFGDNQIFFVETVAGIVEVKSDCSAAALQDAILKTQALGQLHRNYVPTGLSNYFSKGIGFGGIQPCSIPTRASQNGIPQIFSGVIAYGGAQQASTVIGSLANTQNLDFVCILEQNYICVRNRGSGQWAALPQRHNSVYWLLKILIQYLNEFRNRVVLADIDLDKYP